MKKALIIGFVGRNNSGDEMMLEMHRRILMRLGFTQIDISTEMSEDVVSNYRYPIQKILPLEKDYSLVLIGGGALETGAARAGAVGAAREPGSGGAKTGAGMAIWPISGTTPAWGCEDCKTGC